MEGFTVVRCGGKALALGLDIPHLLAVQPGARCLLPLSLQDLIWSGGKKSERYGTPGT